MPDIKKFCEGFRENTGAPILLDPNTGIAVIITKNTFGSIQYTYLYPVSAINQKREDVAKDSNAIQKAINNPTSKLEDGLEWISCLSSSQSKQCCPTCKK